MKKEVNLTLAVKVHMAREAMGLSQGEFGTRIGIPASSSQSRVSKYESAEQNIENTFLYRMAGIFGVTVDHLLDNSILIPDLPKENVRFPGELTPETFNDRMQKLENRLRKKRGLPQLDEPVRHATQEVEPTPLARVHTPPHEDKGADQEREREVIEVHRDMGEDAHSDYARLTEDERVLLYLARIRGGARRIIPILLDSALLYTKDSAGRSSSIAPQRVVRKSVEQRTA